MYDIPAELVLYHQCGGLPEGDLGEGSPGWFQLWPLTKIEELNRSYEVDQNVPGYVGIGSNGGGEMIALSPIGQVIALPFITMDPKDSVIVASSWDVFVTLIRSANPH